MRPEARFEALLRRAAPRRRDADRIRLGLAKLFSGPGSQTIRLRFASVPFMQHAFGSSGTIVDLFSGCGGSRLALNWRGFHWLVAIDIEPTLQSAYRRNFPRSMALQANVTDIEASDWRHFIGRLGQTGSLVARHVRRVLAGLAKNRTTTPATTSFTNSSSASMLRPKFFMMENVEGLLHEDKISVLHSALEALPGRYTVLDPFVVNAADSARPRYGGGWWYLGMTQASLE